MMIVPLGEGFELSLPAPMLENLELPDNEYDVMSITEIIEWRIYDSARTEIASGIGCYINVTTSAPDGTGLIKAPGNYTITFSGRAEIRTSWFDDNGNEHLGDVMVVSLTPSPGGRLSMPFLVFSATLEPLTPPFVRLNNDDDNSNGIQDKDEQSPTDPDIRAMFLMKVEPPNLPGATVRLDYSSTDSNPQRVRVWMGNGSSRTLVPSGKIWSISAFRALPDKTLYIEGIQCSGNENDVRVTLQCVYSGVSSTPDEKNITVMDIDIRVDSNYDGQIELSDARYENQPGRIVLLNDDNDNCLSGVNGLSYNNLEDKDEDCQILSEDDLTKVKFSFKPSVFSHNLKLEAFGDCIKLWKSSSKGPANYVRLPAQYLPTPAENGNDSTLPYILWVEGISRGHGVLKLSIDGDSDLCDEVDFNVVRIGLIPDNINRDKAIDNADRTALVEQGLFRFWVNDDEDNGHYKIDNLIADDEDIPGARSGWDEFDGRDPNCSDDHVNGLLDMHDFFPVWIDIQELDSALPQGIQLTYRIENLSKTINAVLTSLQPLKAGSYLTEDIDGCGPNLDSHAYCANISSFDNNALVLQPAFLAAMKTGKGVILIEGKKYKDFDLMDMLRFRVYNNSELLFNRTLYMKLTEVDAMYRRENLRGMTTPQGQGEPSNMPDSTLQDKDIFFIHGFKVSEENSYAWDSEMFRRLWQSGMNARFHGVRWLGNDGNVDFLNYHLNANNAFLTAPLLNQLMNVYNTHDATIIAHSLGNMVVCAAIKDHNMKFGEYYMLNAAIPSEAFGESNITNDKNENGKKILGSKSRLKHSEWEGYDEKSWCSNWYQLFINDINDNRRKLTWIDRFKDIGGNILNLYSSGDEVLKLNEDNNVDFSTGTEHLWYLRQYRRFTWHKQELFKGRTNYPCFSAATDWCGWGFEMDTTGERLYTKEQVNYIVTTQRTHIFKTTPVFHFYPTSMNDPNLTNSTRDELLAKGVPALSPPCGGIIVNGLPDNTDMNKKNEEWFMVDDSDYQQWLHNDIKNKPFFHTHKVFNLLLGKKGKGL